MSSGSWAVLGRTEVGWGKPGKGEGLVLRVGQRLGVLTGASQEWKQSGRSCGPGQAKLH